MTFTFSILRGLHCRILETLMKLFDRLKKMVLFHYWLEIKVNTNEVFQHYYKDELVGN